MDLYSSPATANITPESVIACSTLLAKAITFLADIEEKTLEEIRAVI